MLASHLVEINELPPNKLCSFIESKHYLIIRQLLETLTNYMEELQNDSGEAGQTELVAILFYKLKDEMNQLMRNDTMIIFPLIRNDAEVNPCPARKLPVDMIKNMHKKIMTILDKLRHTLNNYLSKPEWTHDFKMFCDELLTLEQQILQAIYLKENVLIPKVELKFNQPCGGGCDH